MAGLGPRPTRSGSGLGRSIGPESAMSTSGINEPHRELFDACRAGDLPRVKRLVTTHSVNARDTAGRKSTPLHFAAGKSILIYF
jgi:tankyrase